MGSSLKCHLRDTSQTNLLDKLSIDLIIHTKVKFHIDYERNPLNQIGTKYENG